MDALKKVIGGGNQNVNNTNAGAGTAPAGQKDDYGAAYVNKSYLGGKLNHDQLEKMTDAGREGLEKATGKNVPDKFSN
ncbi:hypothetical protein FHL15_008483 [Xylaria flabelliformis]|uniref:Uncharacterized protein n=1 Tax=Xylaria flabelliformis TaxID=2512241 RepID=A0A553HRY0_9PEZI|nr:hypothetical protein FHL15_008483 [Xylaria flabelliformis]